MKKYRKCLFIIALQLLTVLLAGCAGESDNEMKENADSQINENTYEQISQEDAKALMDSETDYILLDVRTQEEYDEKHIPGAICIPNETIDENVSEQLTDQEQLILVYCRSGNRSKQASQKLADLGYTNIKEFGGINTWPYETE